MTSIRDTENTPSGPRFTKVYDRGFTRLKELISLRGGAATARVWVFLTEHCGHDNALCCTIDLIAEELDLHQRTIRRAIKYLAESNAIVVAKVGTANVYILNCDEVWKTYEERKRFCGFRTRTLLGFKENAGLRKRLTHMLGEPKTGDLFADAAE
jgi:hypothetical protein